MAYAHWTSPEQSNPVFGEEPPHWYGLPRYRRASASAARARGPACRLICRGVDHVGGGRMDVTRAQELPRLLEPELVAAPVLRGRALDVGDPLAVGLLVDRQPAREAIALDGLGVIEEPLHLQLRGLAVARVLALVPDARAHLEEADGVGVAARQVAHAGLDERRHHGQLGRQPAPLGLRRHPRGGLRARRRVARVLAGHVLERADAGGAVAAVGATVVVRVVVVAVRRVGPVLGVAAVVVVGLVPVVLALARDLVVAEIVGVRLVLVGLVLVRLLLVRLLFVRLVLVRLVLVRLVLVRLVLVRLVLVRLVLVRLVLVRLVLVRLVLVLVLVLVGLIPVRLS